jgi:hypothetical protein
MARYIEAMRDAERALDTRGPRIAADSAASSACRASGLQPTASTFEYVFERALP